jgi:hypothetical protein
MASGSVQAMIGFSSIGVGLAGIRIDFSTKAYSPGVNALS